MEDLSDPLTLIFNCFNFWTVLNIDFKVVTPVSDFFFFLLVMTINDLKILSLKCLDLDVLVSF